MSDVVYLVVGGVHFGTYRSTLTSSDSFFTGLASGDDTELFVDRDPHHFRHILNFLRGSKCVPASLSDLRELRVEAEYYSLPAYVRLIDEAIHKPREDISYILSNISNKLQP